jgi:hypothetical protein
MVDASWSIDSVPDIGSVEIRALNLDVSPLSQTWINGQLAGQEHDSPLWHDSGLPTPIWHIDTIVDKFAGDTDTLCFLLRAEIKLWVSVTVTYDGWARGAAYSEHARRAMREHGCAE